MLFIFVFKDVPVTKLFSGLQNIIIYDDLNFCFFFWMFVFYGKGLSLKMSNFSTNGDAVQSTVKGLFFLYSNGWKKIL